MKKLLFLSLMVTSTLFGSDKISTYIKNRFSGLENSIIAETLQDQIYSCQKQILCLPKIDKNKKKIKRCKSRINFLNAAFDQVISGDKNLEKKYKLLAICKLKQKLMEEKWAEQFKEFRESLGKNNG